MSARAVPAGGAEILDKLQTLVGELLARAGLEMHRLDLHGGLGRNRVKCASEMRE